MRLARRLGNKALEWLQEKEEMVQMAKVSFNNGGKKALGVASRGRCAEGMRGAFLWVKEKI